MVGGGEGEGEGEGRGLELGHEQCCKEEQSDSMIHAQWQAHRNST